MWFGQICPVDTCEHTIWTCEPHEDHMWRHVSHVSTCEHILMCTCDAFCTCGARVFQGCTRLSTCDNMWIFYLDMWITCVTCIAWAHMCIRILHMWSHEVNLIFQFSHVTSCDHIRTTCEPHVVHVQRVHLHVWYLFTHVVLYLAHM